MSPVGRPDATERLWCVPCGTVGAEFAERMALRGEPKGPTPRVRICPPCARKGWGLEGQGIDAGAYYRAGSGMTRSRGEGVAVRADATPALHAAPPSVARAGRLAVPGDAQGASVPR